MNEKKHPSTGHPLTITIIVGCRDFCNSETTPETHEVLKCVAPEKPNYSLQYVLHRRNGKTVTLKSERLFKAFEWLQGKEHTAITTKELAEALCLNKDQAIKVLHTLSRDKKLIHYDHDPDGSYRIIRVDDINRFVPKHNGVEDEG